ncbi:hypothetical protein Leryth_025459 [Lithospermum erythrorhizon]|nr:hypothetical protein Leryth_025459 [Lithospermum erythrorhizon]
MSNDYELVFKLDCSIARNGELGYSFTRINSMSRYTYFKKKSKKLKDICSFPLLSFWEEHEELVSDLVFFSSSKLGTSANQLHRYIILLYLEGWPP